MEKKLYVAIIDDDNDDVTLLTECFQKFPAFSIQGFNKGSVFFDFIDSNGGDSLCLMVVDLNLPELDGIGIIKRIKESSVLVDIPVLVFTTGGTPAERDDCEKLNVEVFKKPSSLEEWRSIVLVMASHCEPRLLKNN